MMETTDAIRMYKSNQFGTRQDLCEDESDSNVEANIIVEGKFSNSSHLFRAFRPDTQPVKIRTRSHIVEQEREVRALVARNNNVQEHSRVNQLELGPTLAHLSSLLLILLILLSPMEPTSQSTLVSHIDDSAVTEYDASAHLKPTQHQYQPIKQACNKSHESQQSHRYNNNNQRRRAMSSHQSAVSNGVLSSNSNKGKQSCHDCLHVAVMGDHQMGSYIMKPIVRGPNARSLISTVTSKASAKGSNSMIRQNHSKQATDELQTTTGRHNQSHHKQYGDNYRRSAEGLHQHQHQQHHDHHNSLEPKSDDHCPMTGPSTVCDQINSYPADVILDKLENAKRMLKQSHFNLDSLFSDERDHSSEPFDEPDPSDGLSDSNVVGGGEFSAKKPPAQQTLAKLEDNFANKSNGRENTGGALKQSALAANGRRYRRRGQADGRYFANSANIDHGMDERAINYVLAADVINGGNGARGAKEATIGKAKGRDGAPNVGRLHSSAPHLDTGQNQQRQQQVPQVVHQGGHLSRQSSLSPSSSGDEFLDLVERNAFSLKPSDKQVSYTSKLPSHKSPAPMSNISDRTLVNKLMSSVSNNRDHTHYIGQIDNESYHGHRGGHPSNIEQEILAGDASTRRQQSIMIARRLRRQVAVRVISGNSSGGPVEGRQMDSSVTIEGDDGASGEGDFQNQPEPVCRAKSIYISPRAAVS